ncbi:MAG: lipase family protein [Pirellulaceae bacterium]
MNHFNPRLIDDTPLFRARASDFSMRNSRFLGELSNAAYETSETKLRSELANLDLTDCRLIEDLETDTQALVGSTRQAIVVAFRGTEPTKLKDLLTDVELTMVPGPLGKVHEGFWESLEGIWGKLQRAIALRQDGKRAIWFTGHSLGGALAQLTVARLIQMGRPAQGLYTYGAPRCGDMRFATQFNRLASKGTFRVVNEADIIPDVAPKFLGFEHCGRYCELDERGRMLIDTPQRQGVLHWLEETLEFLFDCEDDHSIAKGYLPKLSALVPWEKTPSPSAIRRAA